MEKKLENKKFWVIGVIVLIVCGFCLIILIGAYGVSKYLESNSQDMNNQIPTMDPVEEYLDDVGPVSMIGELPTKQIDYPENWSADLSLPEAYQLIDAYIPGQSLDNEDIWIARYIVVGSLNPVVEDTENLFLGRGWKLIDSGKLYSNVNVLIFERGIDEFLRILIESSTERSDIIAIQINAYLKQK